MYNKIVILTGSFNPPTLAHLKSIQSAMDHVGADGGFLIPTTYEYLRQKMLRAGDGFVLSDELRSDMLQELRKVDDRLIFGGHEEHHTRDTIVRVHGENPDAEIYFVVGADKLGSLPHWHNAEELLSSTRFIVFQRGDTSVESLLNRNELLRKYSSSFIILPALEGYGDVSSTRIREAFYAGDKAAYRQQLVPGVADILDQLDPCDYHAPTFAEIYRAISKNGMHGDQNAKKMVAEANMDIFPSIEGRDTMLDGTKVYKEEFSVSNIPSGNRQLRAGCAKSSLVAAAKSLLDSGLNPAVLSTADRTKACPGYASGGKLLSEDELCRSSNLSESLYQFGNPKLKAVKEAGVPLKDCAYPLNISFGGIYSPGVTFLRNGVRQCYTLLDEPFSCSVISVPTLSNLKNDKGLVLTEEHLLFDEDGKLNDKGLKVMSDKIRTALRIAVVNGHDSLVIGDFGVSNNVNAEQLASIFKQVMGEPEFTGKLTAIVFAFDEGKGNKRYPVEESGKFGAFYRLFGRYSD